MMTLYYLQKENILVGSNLSLSLETPKLKDLIINDKFDDETYFKACIKSISINGQIYYVDKFVPEELSKVIENLPLTTSTEINNFIKKEPKLSYKVATENEESEVTGFLSFFI